MTARELIHMLLELPQDMEIFVMDEEAMQTVCFGSSQEIEITHSETGEKKMVFMLSPCFCQYDDEFCDCEDEMQPIEQQLKANDFKIDLN